VLDLYRKMPGEITERLHREWVVNMKDNGVWAKTLGDGNCALYSLAVYFHALLNQGEINKLNTWFCLDANDEKWLKGRDLGQVRARINDTALFDNTQVNRQKFVKIYKSHIDNDVDEAGYKIKKSPIGLWGPEKPRKARKGPIADNGNDNANQTVYNNSSLLRQHVTLLFHLQCFLTNANLKQVGMTPADMKKDDAQTQLQSKHELLQGMFRNHLSVYATDREFLSRIFIESVIEQVHMTLHVVESTKCELPFMFGTHAIYDDDPYVIDFKNNKVAISGSVSSREYPSELVFINQNSNHWDLIMMKPYRWNERVSYMKEDKLPKETVFTKHFTNEAVVDMSDDDEGGSAKRSKTDPDDESEPIELDDSDDEGGSAKRPKIEEEIDLVSSDDDGGGVGAAKHPKNDSRNTDAMTAAIMLRMNLV
jgi:hypothetical protein